jgi:hypothetical protein
VTGDTIALPHSLGRPPTVVGACTKKRRTVPSVAPGCRRPIKATSGLGATASRHSFIATVEDSSRIPAEHPASLPRRRLHPSHSSTAPKRARVSDARAELYPLPVAAGVDLPKLLDS